MTEPPRAGERLYSVHLYFPLHEDPGPAHAALDRLQLEHRIAALVAAHLAGEPLGRLTVRVHKEDHL